MVINNFETNFNHGTNFEHINFEHSILKLPDMTNLHPLGHLIVIINDQHLSQIIHKTIDNLSENI